MWPLDLWARGWELPVEWPILENTLTRPGNKHTNTQKHTENAPEEKATSCSDSSTCTRHTRSSLHLHTLRWTVWNYAWHNVRRSEPCWHVTFPPAALHQTVPGRLGLGWHSGSHSRRARRAELWSVSPSDLGWTRASAQKEHRAWSQKSVMGINLSLHKGGIQMRGLRLICFFVSVFYFIFFVHSCSRKHVCLTVD